VAVSRVFFHSGIYWFLVLDAWTLQRGKGTGELPEGSRGLPSLARSRSGSMGIISARILTRAPQP
jgi:hypothetical protein